MTVAGLRNRLFGVAYILVIVFVLCVHVYVCIVHTVNENAMLFCYFRFQRL